MSPNQTTNQNELNGLVNSLNEDFSEAEVGNSALMSLARTGNELMVDSLRHAVAECAQYLDRQLSDDYQAIVLGKDIGKYKFRLGLLKQLTSEEKHQLSRRLKIFSVYALDFVIIEPMVFDILKRHAYEPKTVAEVQKREDAKHTRQTFNFASERVKTDFAANSQRHDISDLTGYYRIIGQMQNGSFDPYSLPTLELLSFILQDFIKSDSSDLHFHSGTKTGRVRYRHQGSVYTRFAEIPRQLFRELVGSLCSLAGKDSSRMRREVVESVVPLRIRFHGEIKNVEFRFESLPTLGDCPSINLRGQTEPIRDINKIGFLPNQKQLLIDAVSQSRGIVIVTGPTGSGKTNTLNTLFNVLQEKDDLVIIELGSPIEIEDEKRVQLTLPDGLTEQQTDIVYQKMFKACMRFDPDVIAFTEIRTRDEARITFRAANTGHLVTTTLHAADVEETFGTVFNWDIDRSVLAKGILAIVSQTLVRKLCDCKIIDDATSDFMGRTVYRENEAGCPDCDRGFRGRTTIAEVLSFNDDVREWIISGDKPSAITQKAVSAGYLLPMREVALQKLADGIVSESEVLQMIHLRTELNDENVFVNSAETEEFEPLAIDAEFEVYREVEN